MPICMLYTNLKESQIPDGLENSLAETVAKLFSKTTDKMFVTIMPGQRMYRLQSAAPTCFLQIHSVGVFDKEKNPTYTPPIIEFLKSNLNLAEERIVIQYLPLEFENIGQILPSPK